MSYAHLKSVELSDVGRQRHRNEDTTLLLATHGLFGVFDGMGGAAGGGEASRAAADAVRRKFGETGDHAAGFSSLKGKIITIRGALNEASRGIRERAEAQGVTGAGTTAVVMVFDPAQPARAVILHAGDSRVYRFRRGLLTQLTRDHSFAVAAGVNSERSLPPLFRGVVTRGVGLERDVVLEETLVDVETGDLFLLCTDGLTKMITDGAIRHILEATPRDLIAQAALSLIDTANRAGGQDNVSVLLVAVGDLPPAAAARNILNFSGEGSQRFDPKPATELIPENVVAAAVAGEENARQKRRINLLMIAAYAAAVLLLIATLWWLNA